MDTGIIVLVLTGVGSLVTLLGWLGFAPNGPHIVASLRARLTAPRRQREEMQQRLDVALQLVKDLVHTTGMSVKLHDEAMDQIRAMQPQVEQLQQDVGVLRMVLKGAASQEDVAAALERIAHVEETLRDHQAALGELPAVMDLPSPAFSHPAWQRVAEYLATMTAAHDRTRQRAPALADADPPTKNDAR